MRHDELLKTGEVAELLRVHPKHVYRLLNQGLPGRRVGSDWRFVRDEVLAWSAARGERNPPLPRPEVPATAATPPLLAANGDLVVEILLAAVLAGKHPPIGFVQADRGRALEYLGTRAILLAGFHGDKAPPHLRRERLARIHLVRRQVGLAHPATVPIRGVRDVARRRLATRPRTAGVRAHFDRALAATGIKASRIRGTSFDSHRDAVAAVVRREAEVALTTSAWAARMGLAFFALAEESYDLVLFADQLGDAHVVGVCEVAQSKAFRAALGKVAGYDPRAAGEIRYELPET